MAGSLFDGTWGIDVSASVVWDAARNDYVADDVGEEIIRISTLADVQDYEVLYGDDPRIRMGYTSRFDSPDWVEYAIRDITTMRPDGSVELAVEEFRRRIKADSGTGYREFVVGECYGLVRIIAIDERSHFRVAKYPTDGRLQTMMLRSLEVGDDAYMASVMDAAGRVYRRRRFVRVADL